MKPFSVLLATSSLLFLTLASCSAPEPPPTPQPPAPLAIPAASTPSVAPAAVAAEKKPSPLPPPATKAIKPAADSGQRHPLKVRTASLNGTTFTAVTFDRRDYFLKVLDQKSGPGSEYDSAQDAGRGSLAAINGGFFNPDGSPLGLVISNGEIRGSLNSRSFLGTGILDGKKVTLSTRGNYQKSSELLQSGPRLVWAGETLTGLSSKNDRPRSLLIWDGRNHFGLVHASSATLQGLSNNLRAQPLEGFDIKYALNLDGGTSCDLWVSSTVPNGGFTKSSFLKKKARNYLALRKR